MEQRREYNQARLRIEDCPPDPTPLLMNWLNMAIEAGIQDAAAMVLSTVGADLMPASRVVLLRGLDENGLAFFTNYASKKGQEISRNNKASLLFFWSALEKQIRIEGTIYLASPEQSTAYFNSRPLESRINAIISPQSEEIPNHQFLLNRKTELLQYLKERNEEPKRPNYWGGYILKPHKIEFWQGGPGRLNDRVEYSRSESSWVKRLLAP